MIVTFRGKDPKDNIWVGKCSYCKSEAEATEDELKEKQIDMREHTCFAWEVCPVCSTGPYGGMLFYPKEPKQ